MPDPYSTATFGSRLPHLTSRSTTRRCRPDADHRATPDQVRHTVLNDLPLQLSNHASLGLSYLALTCPSCPLVAENTLLSVALHLVGSSNYERNKLLKQTVFCCLKTMKLFLQVSDERRERLGASQSLGATKNACCFHILP